MTELLDRRALVRGLLEGRGDTIVVAGLGAPSWDITAVGDTPLNLPLWGGMGGAAMVGLGLALTQPARTVLVITGDGEMLMGLGSLATIAVQAPPNLVIVVQDNERYGETGSQETHTARGVDLLAIARGAGFKQVSQIATLDQARTLRATLAAGGPLFALAKVVPEAQSLALPPREGAYLTARLREAVLGREAHGS